MVCMTLVHADTPSDIHVTGDDYDSPLTVGANDTITIEESMGVQRGINQFFTFDKFGIGKDQVAYFKRTTETLQNVISRVIGGETSFIDGKITSDFPNFYLLNPAGVIFGPHAMLNIPGSFHVSTAHKIRGSDTNTFFGVLEDSNVFMDHPAAFGFIDIDRDNVGREYGKILIQGLGEYDPVDDYDPERFTPGLSVNAEQTISLIGREIEIEQGAYYYDDTNTLINPETLYANAGRINLVSVESGHEVPLQHIFKVESIDIMNKIEGAHAGDIAIVSTDDQKVTYQYKKINETLQWDLTENLTTIPGVKIGAIDPQAQMENIRTHDRARLSVDKFTQSPDPEVTYNSRSGEIFIKGGEIVMDKTYVLAQNCSDEQGGDINIQGKSILIKNDSLLTTEVARDQEADSNNQTVYIDGKGAGGNILIKGNKGNHADSVRFFRSIVSTGTKSLDPAASSGHIDIQARNISLFSSYQITDSIYDSFKNTLPDEVYQKLSVLKNIDYTSLELFMVAIIKTLTSEEWNLNKSTILEAVQVGSSISSDVNGYGQGGNITLNALDSVNILGKSKIFANAKNADENAGSAGYIKIDARTIFLTEMNSEISSQTLGPGEGGNISLFADDLITVNEFASIRAETGSSGSSSSSTKDNGSAGDILLDAPRVSILKGGIVESSTYVQVSEASLKALQELVEQSDTDTSPKGKGQAGNITIRATDLIHLSGSDVVNADASSIRNRSQNTARNAGWGGKVKLTARVINFEDGAFIGSETYGGGEVSSDVYGGRGGDVELNAEEIHFSGTDSAGYACKIYTNSLFSNTQSEPTRQTAGKAGNITLKGKDLIKLEDGAGVTASTMGPGAGGSVVVEETQRLEIIGGNPHGENEDGFASGIFARSAGKGRIVGNADSISLKVEDLIIEGGGVISNSTLGAGDAGSEGAGALDLNILNQLVITGEGETTPQEDPLASQINFNRMYTSEKDYRSGIYSTSESTEPYAGNAGNVIIKSPSITMSDRATISTSTKGAGKAGNIELKNVKEISLTNGATISSATFSDSNIQHFVVDDLNNIKNLDISKGDFVELEGDDHTLYYYRGEGYQDPWIEVNSNTNTTMVKYSFRIFSIGTESDLNALIPERGDIAQLGDQYYYFYKVWNKVNQALTLDQIPAFLNDEKVLSNSYNQGDIAQMVNIPMSDQGNNSNINYTFNGSDWKELPGTFDFSDNASAYFTKSEVNAVVSELFSFIDDRTRLVEQYLHNGNDWTKYQYDGDAGKVSILNNTNNNTQLNLKNANTSISTSTYGRGNAGLIEIEALNMQLSDNSEISSASLSNGNGGDAGQIIIGKNDNSLNSLNISTAAQINTSTEGLGNAGNIEVYANQISMQSEGTIASSSNALGDSGHAGNIIVNAGSLSLIHENTSVNTSTYGQGDAGNIDLYVNDLDLDQKSSISSASNSIGKGGDAGIIRIGLAYEKNTNLETKEDKPYIITKPSERINVTNESSISTASAGKGKAGLVLLGANNIDVHQSASISSANSSVADIIYYIEKLDLINDIPKKNGAVVEVADDGFGNPKTYIYTGSDWVEKNQLSLNRVATMAGLNALNVESGDVAKVTDAGDGYSKNFIFDGNEWQPIDSDKTVQVYISSTKDKLSVDPEKGDILYTTSNSGVYIFENNTWQATQWSSVSGAKDFQVSLSSNQTLESEIPNNVPLNEGDRANVTKNDETTYYVRINKSGTPTWEPVSKAGNAGNINIVAEDQVTLNTNGSLNTEAISSGGGKISIEGKKTLYLFEGLITASVQKGFGAGGDINTRSKSVIMNHSGIEANAVEGDGGAIFIKTEQYIKSNDSYVTATSERGNDGTVKIDAPKVDISKGLVVLPANFLDATRWVKTPCALRSGESVSRLVLEGRDAIPTSLIDWQPSPPLDISDIKKTEKKKKSSQLNRPTLLKSKKHMTIKKDLTQNFN